MDDSPDGPEFFRRMAAAGWQKVDSVNDLLPAGHPLKGKQLAEADKLWKSWEDGSRFEEQREPLEVVKKQRALNSEYLKSIGVPFLPPGNPGSPIDKSNYLHLKGDDERTFCGIDTLTALVQDEGGQWRDPKAEELADEMCPECQARMDNAAAGSDSEVPE